MACGACERRRKRMLEEKARRAKKGEKVAPALIGATLAVIDAVAGKPGEKKEAKG